MQDHHPSGFINALYTIKTRSTQQYHARIRDAQRDGGNICASARTLALAVCVAVIMGVAAWAFLAALDVAQHAREDYPALFVLLPFVAAGTAWVYHTHGKRAGKGNNLVIESADTGTPIGARMAILTFICSVATHLAGGSAGREGTAVQIGGTLASNVAQLTHLDGRDRNDLMLAGISAAFAAIFGTPLAGAFFGMELCQIGRLSYRAAPYCLVAAFTGDAVTRALGANHALHTIQALPATGAYTLFIVCVAGILFGLTARCFSFAVRSIKRFWARNAHGYLFAAAAGGAVVLLAYALFWGWRYAGLSDWMIGAGFAGTTTFGDVVAKLLFTALTLGAGFQGGEVTPLFCLGASLGGWIGTISGIEPSFTAALGMACVFGAALNVPITTVMLALDLFGGQGAGYFALTAFIAYIVAGHRSIYPAQRIATPKRRSLEQDRGTTIQDALERTRKETYEDPRRTTQQTSTKA